MDDLNPTELFDAHYYAKYCGRPYQRDESWLSFFGGIADQIVQRIQPKTVLDAGCAMGFLVEALRQRGVEAYGVDISEYAIRNVHPSIQPYCWTGSVADPFPQRYDLIVSIEVLEHMSQNDALKAVENFSNFSDDVLFSSTPFDYKEATHFNVQPPEIWGELFARHGLLRDTDFDASFITAWAVRYRRKAAPTPEIVRDYERKFFLLWKENSDLRSLILDGVLPPQINFLLQQTLHEIEESRKDKVTTKAGMRKNEIWKEVTTAGRQIVPVGLLNVALRLTQAKAKLVGVDEVRYNSSEIIRSVAGEGSLQALDASYPIAPEFWPGWIKAEIEKYHRYRK